MMLVSGRLGMMLLVMVKLKSGRFLVEFFAIFLGLLGLVSVILEPDLYL